ncbi:MAG: 30S ribosomal protein S3, partial [Symbiobacterium thermophilum]
GQGIAELQNQLAQMTDKQISLDVKEIRLPELDAQLVAESIAQQLEKRMSHRRAMKQAIQRAMRLGAQGVRIIVSGRIGGAEIARSERAWEGTVPLHTLRADIDYGFAEADTTFGKIGVKVWIYAGEAAQKAAAGDRRERGERRERGGRRGGRGRGQGGQRMSREERAALERAAIEAGPKPVNREGGQ